MRSRNLIQTLAMVAAVCCLFSVQVEAKQPNFVFVMADDCTFRDIGCYGGQAHTPHIDRLATEGMRFTRCFQAAPMCSPTRHNIYTGQYPVKIGAYPNHTNAYVGVKSIVQYLKPLGYRVALSGKTHIGPKSVFPFEKPKGAGLVKAAGNFFADCKEENDPFCVFFCSNEPHTPWNKGDPSRYEANKLKLPPYFVDTPETREVMTRYLAEITYFDGEVGGILAALDESGLRKNTLVIVVSEQGSSMPFAKWTCYDSGLQSAFIARWPGKIQPGSINRAMIEYVDLVPTYVEAAGGTPDRVLDGKSLLPVFAGKQEHKEYVFGEMTTRGIHNGSDTFGIRSVRSKQFKYIWNFTPEIEFRNICMLSPEFKSWETKAATGDADAAEKVRRYKNRPGVELYDITKDPTEWNNLAGKPEYASVQAELKAELEAWMKRCGDKGQQTELDAYKRTRVGKKKNKRKKK
ncbi:MAG: sulfatase [Planctomycetes bacterium]|nr:sulfatase [Planctomycetota bacterium]MCH9725695.1 sulfatase [Planctomycetota bacterium]MCH9777750.1 sulfatase [Planctomycetota bacterium]MCH9791202.1 sulfatase [Planctomycetota bacterium]